MQGEDTLSVYLEYVSGGSIHKLLQEYGKLGEQAIRSYTQQILSGLAYLHAKNTVHRYTSILVFILLTAFLWVSAASSLRLLFMILINFLLPGQRHQRCKYSCRPEWPC